MSPCGCGEVDDNTGDPRSSMVADETLCATCVGDVSGPGAAGDVGGVFVTADHAALGDPRLDSYGSIGRMAPDGPAYGSIGMGDPDGPVAEAREGGIIPPTVAAPAEAALVAEATTGPWPIAVGATATARRGALK